MRFHSQFSLRLPPPLPRVLLILIQADMLKKNSEGFGVFTAVAINFPVVWNITPCIPIYLPKIRKRVTQYSWFTSASARKILRSYIQKRNVSFLPHSLTFLIHNAPFTRYYTVIFLSHEFFSKNISTQPFLITPI